MDLILFSFKRGRFNVMFGIISEFIRLKRFYDFANKLLYEGINYLIDNYANDFEILFEDYELTTNLMMTQIVAITSDGLIDFKKSKKLRIALLSSFSRKSIENEKNLKRFFNHSLKMEHHSKPSEVNRKEMYYHVGKWTIDTISTNNSIRGTDFSEEFIIEVGALIYNTSIEAAVNSKLIK